MAAILMFNTIRVKHSIEAVEKVEVVSISEKAIDHLEEAITIKTISYNEEELFDSTQFELFNNFLINTYPLLNSQAEHKIFNSYSHLYKLEGTDNSKMPILLMAHHDVVPIASPALWSVHPFDEGVKQDTIYGRGCIDDKGAAISILESIEQLLKEGFETDRTIYLSLGHDEEVGGQKGAHEISTFLKSQNVELAFVLDEGGAITQGLIPGLDQPTAVIGIAEKGMVSLELDVMMAGGHSSKPEKETAIAALASAISTLSDHPFPKHMTPVMEEFLDAVGPHMGISNRVAIANRWLFNSIILNQYEQSSQGNASVRTTTAPTLFQAGIKDNVIPTMASATVNFRILPGETIETTVDYVKDIIDDSRISINIKGSGFDPSPISSVSNAEYALLSKTIRSMYPDIITCPNLVIGATDARYFSAICPNIYRFTPWKLSPNNINCFHGVDERIGINEFEDAIRFYRQLIINFNNLE